MAACNFVASFYPQEHRTPPLPLVALLGCPELHREIGDFFIQQHRPPLVFHGSNEPIEQFVARAFGPKKQSVLLGPVMGILKSDWFAKHRGKKPAMAVALVERRDLEGDPSTWNRLVYGLKLIADGAGQRGAGLIVGVVQQQGLGELPPDRVQAVAHNLSLDRRLILPLPLLPPPGTPADDPAVKHVRDGCLGRLGKLVLELCTAYYSRLSRHVADKAAQRRAALNGPLPPELAARTAFKLAVYAEFRQDWATAVAHYREAYAGCLAVQVVAAPAQGAAPARGPASGGGVVVVKPQKWTEVCAVAELVHLKLLMLAVHQGRVEEAVAQVRAHLGHFRSPPGSLPPPAASSHHGYLVRQHQVAAQEVGSHVDSLPPYLPATFTHSALGLGAQQATPVPGTGGVGAGPTGGGGGGSGAAGGGWAAGGPVGGGGGGLSPPGLPPQHPQHPHFHHISAPPPAGYPHGGQQLITGGGAAAGPTGLGSSFTGASAGSITGGTVAVPSSSLKDCSRPHLLMAAARLAVARRQAADAMRSARGMAVGGGGGGSSGASGGAASGAGGGGGGGGGGVLLDTAPVRRGAFVGQLVLRNEAVQGGYSPLSDSDYCLFLESEECRLVTPALAIDVMNSALILLKDCTGADRLRSQLGGLMAGEHMLAGNLSAARKLLLQVCHQYRREGWLLPLLQALVSLREVAQRLRLPSEHLCYSLEICALATQLQPPPQAAAAAAAAAAVQPPQAGAAAPHPITLLTQGGGGAGAGGVVSMAVTETASCAARIVDPNAAMVACRSAVSTLISGISDIKQGIMKNGTPSAPSSGAATPPEPVTPDSSAPQVPLPHLTTAAAAAAAAGGGAGAPPVPGTAPPPPTVTSGGLPRHFHYTVEHLDLREAQRRAREAGDPRPVADIMHRHSQHDYGWCRCVALAAGFAYGRPAGDADTADFYLGLYNQLPLGLPLKGVILHFADDVGDTWVQALPGPIPADEPPAMPLPGHVGAALDSATHSFHHLHLNTHLKPHNARQPQQQQQQGAAGPGGVTGPAEGDGTERLPGQLHFTDGPPSSTTSSSTTSSSSTASATLPPHRWAHYSVRLAPRCLGRLRAERAILLLSDHATIVFKLASFPPATAAAAQPGVLTGPLLAPPTAVGRQARTPSLSAAAAVACGLPSVDHAAAPFRSIRAPGPVAGPAVAPGQLVFNVAHLGPLPSLSYGLPTGLALLGEHAPLLAVLAVPAGGRPLVGAAMEFVIGRTGGGLQPSDIVLVVDDAEGPTKGLMALNNERYRIPLPPVQPGRRHTVRLWARSAAAGTAAVAAMLLCPAQVTASATLTFEEPFEFKCRLSSEVGVHTLSLPRVNARELGATQLTIGQPVMVTALVRALQPALLELAGAQVALEPGAAIKLVADPAQQLSVLNGGVGGFDPRGTSAAAAGGAGGGGGGGIPGSAPGTAPPSPLRLQNGAGGATGAAGNADAAVGGGGGSGPVVVAPSRLCRGDVFTLLLPICPTEMLEHARSMGRLNLRWRRAAGHGLRAAMPALGDGDPDEADPLAEPCPDPWVTTTLELPRVTVADSLLTARTVLSQTAVTAGIPFTYSLQLQNFGSTPLELMVSLTDSPSFACAGERSPSLTVPPRERASVSWQLTAPAAGHLALPAVRLLAPRHNCALTTQSPHVYVAPF
ncbi:hypothetical protein CHLRE_17g729700v5 [Chlamydomonas reinhardtii]|uniref:Trafficking protein particle complex subunit 11 domain-containing protein n=1 Tax=Chlamydomonas reinhardtii TaxID=3055 RepID=A0A2K3CQW7_CHLRE|nr:uncharacterized protein CHLRE_17g729700v5 [Chlamydomonas reinhardtii]PNW70671.1 hypothetical protein CHLRE_17g729700v5 [Chlamydomonas reinhardtii]